MISTLESNIRLQQYRFKPKLSSTSLAFSPVFMRLVNSSHRSPTSLPQVKHLTGIIILFFLLPVTFLFLGPCACSADFLCFFGSGVSGNHGSVIFIEDCA